jgi:hypothetical protein
MERAGGVYWFWLHAHDDDLRHFALLYLVVMAHEHLHNDI